mmetsp:Transcript_36379/g.113397  ORF Transcript_36379/g.113397 Transcript_36379/m.113397 type:complete len:88 (-) Transcript_36379:294-557(-)
MVKRLPARHECHGRPGHRHGHNCPYQNPWRMVFAKEEPLNGSLHGRWNLFLRTAQRCFTGGWGSLSPPCARRGIPEASDFGSSGVAM